MDWAQASYDDAVLLLSTRICDTLADLRESVRQLSITQASIRRNERSLQLVESRFNVGLGNELELAQARRTLAEAKAQLPQAEIGPRAACDALAALLGRHGERQTETASLTNRHADRQANRQTGPINPTGVLDHYKG